MSFCVKCGQELKEEKFCPACGTATEAPAAEVSVTPSAAATAEKKSGFSFKKILSWVLVGVIILSVGSCFFGGDEGGGAVTDSSGFEKDTWYTYKPAPNLSFQNAMIESATYMNDDNTKMRVICFPYCVECEERLEMRSYILSAQFNNSMEEEYTCDHCGGTVTLRAEWNYDY